MINFFCVAIILAVAYAMHHEGLFNSLMMLINVIIAGLLAFEFWEPLADFLEPMFQGGNLAGFEDHIAMASLFLVFLVLLRWVANTAAFSEIELEPNTNRAGSVIIGLLTGYLVAGFLVCSFETLTWDENFMGFTPQGDSESAYRSVFPPDRVWLAMMRRAGAYPMCWHEAKSAPADADNFERYQTFDTYGTFDLRYTRYRRDKSVTTGDTVKYKPAMTYQGEFDREMKRE